MQFLDVRPFCKYVTVSFVAIGLVLQNQPVLGTDFESPTASAADSDQKADLKNGKSSEPKILLTSTKPQFESENARIRESLEQHVAQLFDAMSPSAKAGYSFLVDKPYLPPDFNDRVLQYLDESELKSPLLDNQVNDVRLNTWKTFGLSPRHDQPTKPLQYVVTDSKEYVMNCFACHGGNTYGATFPGAPNTTYTLEALTENVRRVKLRNKIPLSHMDVGSVFMPLGTTVGASNAVMFGVALMNFRDRDLNVTNRTPAQMTHHDMDAPPWWNVHRKSHIYIDGFADKGHKGLMQFMLVRQNGPEKFRSWAKDFEDVYQFISELRPPKYPLHIDEAIAERGQMVFERNCASCHGTYGKDSVYPEINIPIDEIGTDRVRYDSLTPAHRKHYGDSWFADYGQQQTIEAPEGYTAPPLDGIWASAPYLHNGSVPTLWHLLHVEDRPTIWRRTSLGLDTNRMGFQIEAIGDLPKKLNSYEQKWYFDTRVLGKSAAGHDYPSALSESEKADLLEYLKTL